MEFKEKYESNLKNTQLILFGFELNRSQTALFLILSLIGVLLFPPSLAGVIIYDLFQSIFVHLPSYHEYHSYYSLIYGDYEQFLFGIFAPIFTGIIVYIILSCLSIYILEKILKSKKIKNVSKKKVISQNRIVNWLGFKLTHGQSLIIFFVSLAGILFTIQSFIDNYIPTGDFDLFEAICYIPTDSDNGSLSIESHEILLKNVPIGINATFLIFCFYSLIATRRGKAITSSKKVAKSYTLLIFISSFIISIFLLARLFCHIALFNYELSYLLGIPPHTTTSQQNIDFILVFILLIICLILMIASYFIKENSFEGIRIIKEISWFHIKLSPKRAIILVSLAIVSIIVLSTGFLAFFMMLAGDFIFAYWHLNYFSISFLVIYILIIILCFHSIEKVLKKHALDNFINEIENLEEFETNWFKFRLNRLYSIIFFSISCGFIIFYVYQIISLNMFVRLMISEGDIYIDSYEFFSEPLWISILVFLIIINIYTIKRTLSSLKSN